MGFFEGWGIFRFQMRNEEKRKKKRERKKGKKNFVNLRRQRRQRRADFSSRYESPELTGESGIHFVPCPPPSPPPSSLCLSPYPHFHKHIQLSRHGTAAPLLQPRKSCSSTVDFSKMSERSRVDILTAPLHILPNKKQQADNMTGPSGRKISHLHAHAHTHTCTLTHTADPAAP